jgi:hypothetical protein
MSSELVYEPVPEFNGTEVEQAIRRNDPEELLIVGLSAALYLEPDFSESICLQLAEHPHFNVRGNAILGFSHIARLHGRLNKLLVRPVIVRALTDDHEYVRGQAEAVKDDLEHFLCWKL